MAGARGSAPSTVDGVSLTPASPLGSASRHLSARLRPLPAIMEYGGRVADVRPGLALTLLGALLLFSPLTSYLVLGVYLGVNLVIWGIADLLARPRGRRRQAAGAAGLLVGVSTLAHLDLALRVLPYGAGLLLILHGVAGLAGLRRGRAGELALAGARGLARVGFGGLALLWPDVTLFALAVITGLQLLRLGLTVLWRGIRRFTAGPAPAPPPGPGPAPAESEGASDGVPERRGSVTAAALRWCAAVMVVTVVAGSWFVSHGLRSAAPRVDAFYDAPEDLPSTPGQVLRTEAFTGQVPAHATVRRILYTTTDAHGDAALASGLVVVPEGESTEPRRVVIWNHGTTGVARACAPSLMEAAVTPETIPAIAEVISAGWVIVATDYSGQGAEGDFPYLIGEGQARSALDGVRAVASLEDVELSDEVAIWGHSQGGHAALWTAALAPEYAPELDVVGTAAISPAADPLALAERMTAGGASGVLAALMSWVLIPYAQTYEDVRVQDYVALPGRTLVEEMSQRCASEPAMLVSVLQGVALSHGQPLFSGDVTGGAIGERLAENTTHGPFPSPLVVAWGGQDEVIAADLQHDYVADLCRARVEVSWQEYPDEDHMGVVRPGSPFVTELFEWTSARFAGEPAPSGDC